MTQQRLALLVPLLLAACGSSGATDAPETSEAAATSEPEVEAAATPEASGSTSAPDDGPPAATSSPSTTDAAQPPAGVDPVTRLREHEAELAARPEKAVTEVRVQHVLVAFQGAMRSRATRSKDDAEKLAADLYARLVDGDDIGELMREYSDDPGAGVYTMTTGRPGGGVFARQQMVPAFGNVGWRLEVGEVGVAPYDSQASPFGWHVIKRLK